MINKNYQGGQTVYTLDIKDIRQTGLKEEPRALENYLMNSIGACPEIDNKVRDCYDFQKHMVKSSKPSEERFIDPDNFEED